ncbi:putative phage abortive infection protein [Microbulbifer sp. JMSA002]|uniref:putative phage abortive infection protein n=1 Tax=Microbulbifer sp. JMSA002 TaxID=3243368 RepID=UPI00403A4B1A
MEIDSNQIDTSPKWRSLIRDFKRLIAVSLIIAICAGAMYASTFNGGLSNDSGVWGAFGDFMGGVLNPIFAFMGLIALLLTISMQSEELNNSTKELRNSAEALMEQSKSLERQNFENTFFQLISLHNEIVSGMKKRTGSRRNGIELEGRFCFTYFYGWMKEWYDELYLENFDHLTASEHTYQKFLEEGVNTFGHYFKNLYEIFRFIDESKADDKEQYIRILRAQLSLYEEVILFYDCVHRPENDDIKGVLEKYSFFSNLDKKSLFDDIAHPEMYKPLAFGVRAETLDKTLVEETT